MSLIKCLTSLLIILGVIGCKDTSDLIILTNTSEYDLTYKNMVLSNSELEIDPDLIPLVLNHNNDPVPSQVNDLDGDGTWDELAFQVSIPAGDELRYRIRGVKPNSVPLFEKKTQVHLGYSPDRNDIFTPVEHNQRPADHVAQSTPYLYQYEGPGWENNKVAFRSYFDSRNGKDIFGKQTNAMITDQIGIEENYHTLQSWGMDILKVGNSLGAGAIAIKRGEELIRLGNTKTAEFKILYQGPVRSSFQLIYTGWDVEGVPYQLTETITIWANTRWYQNTVQLTPSSNDTLVTGIVNLNNAIVGTESESGFRILYTHGMQSENNDHLGMALIVAEENFAGYSKAPDSGNGITNTEMIWLEADQQTYSYFFYAGWEGENSDFNSIDHFKDSVLHAARQLSAFK